MNSTKLQPCWLVNSHGQSIRYHKPSLSQNMLNRPNTLQTVIQFDTLPLSITVVVLLAPTPHEARGRALASR